MYIYTLRGAVATGKEPWPESCQWPRPSLMLVVVKMGFSRFKAQWPRLFCQWPLFFANGQPLRGILGSRLWWLCLRPITTQPRNAIAHEKAGHAPKRKAPQNPTGPLLTQTPILDSKPRVWGRWGLRHPTAHLVFLILSCSRAWGGGKQKP